MQPASPASDDPTAARPVGFSAGAERVRALAAVAPRVVPLAGALARSVRRFAIGGALGALTLCLLVVWPLDDVAGWRWLTAGVLLIVLLAPVAVLFLFDRALGELSNLPERLRSLPELATAQREELGRVAAEVRQARRLSAVATIRSIWSLARALWPVWAAVTAVVPSARMLLPPFSLLVVASVVACAIEVVLAVVLVLIVLLI